MSGKEILSKRSNRTVIGFGILSIGLLAFILFIYFDGTPASNSRYYSIFGEYIYVFLFIGLVPLILEFFYVIYSRNEYIIIDDDILMIGRKKIRRDDINNIILKDSDKSFIEIHHNNKIQKIYKIEISEDIEIIMDKIVLWHVSAFS
jgi:hypothetical protein